MKKKKRKADLILIFGMLTAGLILGLVLLLTHRGGKTVQVRISGTVMKSFSLTDDLRYEIRGKNGGRNLLVIKDGAAWVEEADCPDGLCRNMGRISKTGQSVVCLPHEVVIEITDGDGTGEEPDIIVN